MKFLALRFGLIVLVDRLL